MDKVMVTIILLLAGVVCAMAVFGAVYPAITSTGSSILSMASKVSDRVGSEVEIIAVAGQADNMTVWVKNVGSTTLGGYESCDVFFGPEDNWTRISYEEAGSPAPCWTCAVEGDTRWGPGATLKITICVPEPLESGRYMVKVVTPDAIYDKKTFSI